MSRLFIVFVIVFVALLSSSSKKKKKESGPVPNRPRQAPSVPNRPRQAVRNAAANAGHRAKQAASDWRKQLYEADAERDSHYDRGSLDYCDSNVPASGGISFRDLPAGSDELQYLRRWNAQREKLLERSLESRS